MKTSDKTLLHKVSEVVVFYMIERDKLKVGFGNNCLSDVIDEFPAEGISRYSDVRNVFGHSVLCHLGFAQVEFIIF